MGNILFAKGLSNKELQDIRKLEDECNNDQQLNMKLNWDMLERRPSGETNDFLYYEQDRLVGFLGLYDIEGKSQNIEITGMVHPEHRCKGIFHELFGLAKQECLNRKAKKMLLVTERCSKGGKGFVNIVGSKYSFSEYRMKFQGTTVPQFPDLGITLRKPEPADYPELKALDKIGFGSDEEVFESSSVNDGNNSVYIAELDGNCMGKIGILMDGKDGYIFGFVIKPEYRRRGYGRAALSLAMMKLISEQMIHTLVLEVAVENERALHLYKSCGFEEITVYDYYEMILE